MKALGVMLFMVCVVPGPLAGEEQDDGGFIIVNHSERTPEETDAARKELLNIEIRLPKDRHQRLPKTMRKLSKGPAVRIVMLGDSIINDLSRSSWSRYLAKQYPDCEITCITCVKGGAGCWYYKKPKMLERYVLAQKPDLLIIGGISHQFDVDAIYECIELTKKKLPECEYLVMTGPFGEADPLVGRDWRARLQRGKEAQYAVILKKMADVSKSEYFDLQEVWGESIRSAGKPVKTYKRDGIHANARGEAMLGMIMEQYFLPAASGK